MLQLRTFGGLWVSDANRQRVGRSLGRKPLALLALLARANGQAIARDKLLALLWPEKDQGHARNALNQTTFVIRRSLGSDFLELERHEIALVADAWRTDVGDFERALAVQALERAVALYTGPFLDAFYVPDAGELERWVESERSALRRKYLRALEQLATASESRMGERTAAGWWMQLALAEPASSHYTFALMRALAATGEDAAAIDRPRSTSGMSDRSSKPEAIHESRRSFTSFAIATRPLAQLRGTLDLRYRVSRRRVGRALDRTLFRH